LGILNEDFWYRTIKNRRERAESEIDLALLETSKWTDLGMLNDSMPDAIVGPMRRGHCTNSWRPQNCLRRFLSPSRASC